MPTVLITPEAIVGAEGPHTELLRTAGFEIAFPKNPQFSRGLCDQSESIEELSIADAVVAGSEVINAAVIEQLPRLRVIARNGVGYDRVDVPAATANNIAVTITPTANHAAVAEHALALLFAVSKNLINGDRATRAGQWPRNLIEPVRGKTIGILGLGRIGRSMAVRASALGMRVIAYDAVPDLAFARAHMFELVEFDELVRRSDVLSIHCPVTDQTRGMINRDVFDRMQKNAILINTARGAIVNEADLVDALQRGAIKAAGLDVYEVEPTSKDNPLFQLDNVVLTPHTAGADALAMQDMAIESASCVVQLYRGQWPNEAVVNNELRGSWQW
jgi:phosphoglycerate dehydrogenase-like enzyme